MNKIADFIFTPTSSNTLSNELTVTLRDAIITGAIKQGSKLSETKLAKELDVSRGPLREAIRRLEGMNLIHHIAQQGARVVTLDTELHELYNLIKMFRYQSKGARTSTTNSLVEHRQLVYAIEQRDPVLAEVTTRRHIVHARERIERRLKEA